MENTEFKDPIWYLESPGVMRLENTNICIVGDFKGPVFYFITYNGNKVGVGFDLESAKQSALIFINALIEMGMEP